jgi:ubiquinone/menaquinone biosynthesis C-methylase UbiE
VAQSNADTVAVFNLVAETYDAVAGVDFFSTFGRDLVAAVGPRPGERVLDIGCGRGAVLWPAAEAVGPTGHVLAVDLAERMVDLTSADARSRGLAHVEVRVGDASAPEVEPSSVDAVIAGLVLFFLPDPAAALAAYHRALRPGGRLGFSSFGSDDPAWSWLPELKEFLPEGQRGWDPPREGPFASCEGLVTLVDATGFSGPSCDERRYDVRFRGPDHWLEWSHSHGGRAMWLGIPPERRRDAEAHARRRLTEMAASDGTITAVYTLRYTTAVRN